MKIILQLLIGGCAGFLIAYTLMGFSGINFAGDITVIGLLVISVFLIALSILKLRGIKSLSMQNFSGDAEDEAGDKKYKMFTDYSLYTNSSFILSILALSLSVITTQNYVISIASLILLIITSFLMYYMTPLTQKVYPERDIPSLTNPNYAKSVLDIADDGEKHVILDGLYKSQGLLNFSLIIAIILATIYSISGGNSQVFSIIFMAAVLLVVNSKYLLTVRNK
ncbi:DUF3169 family protein [Sporosarcina ureilytica]|uniref:DUF3169 domain-containing protein n=1 Tax=Sporosarcina ureilytica TaxID=298596 RepID=A0A1D8JD69_9BACL|nr:DUF3169 family protein [Sporosarcina ureilytica]AOV06641.1 hypothetical protein BI350_02805 [Sporosarcina ureilytica]